MTSKPRTDRSSTAVYLSLPSLNRISPPPVRLRNGSGRDREWTVSDRPAEPTPALSHGAPSSVRVAWHHLPPPPARTPSPRTGPPGTPPPRRPASKLPPPGPLLTTAREEAPLSPSRGLGGRGGRGMWDDFSRHRWGHPKIVGGIGTGQCG